jgi:hypothetical protein
MADDTSRFHRFVCLCDDMLDLGKDFSILLLVVLFLFFGTFLRKKLNDLGIKEIGPITLSDVQQQNQGAKAAAQQLSSLNQQASEIEAELSTVAARNPGAAKDIAPIKDELNALASQVSSADQSLKTTMLSQQSVLTKASAQTVESTGWIYVGQADETKQAWSGIGAKNLSPAPSTPKFQVGQTLVLASDVYVHNSPPAGSFRNQGDVVAVWNKGDRVEVLDQDASHARAGGWFLWLKVKHLVS